MTTTPLNYFDKVPGTIEQLVLGVITQKLINQDFIPDLLKTDFTTNAIDWNVAIDSDEGLSINGNLSLSMTFPTLPYERQILTDRDTFDKRVMSINSLSVDTLSLAQKPNYPIKSTEPKLPDYLSEAVSENILERRLIALCLYIRNYLNWIDRWNICASQWILATYWNQVSTTLSLAEIEARRDDLLLELASGCKYVVSPVDSYIYPTKPIALGNPSSAKALTEYFTEGSGDPAGGSSASPLSSNLLDSLVEASNSNFSSSRFSTDTPTKAPEEEPTLPNC